MSARETQPSVDALAIRIAGEAPPLTDAQRDRLSALVAAAGGGRR